MFSLYVSLIHYREFWDHYYLPQLSPFLQFLLNLFLSYFRFFSSGARCLFSWSERELCNHRREAAPLNWYLMFPICKTKEIFNYTPTDETVKQCINQGTEKGFFAVSLGNCSNFKWKVWRMTMGLTKIKAKKHCIA